MTFDLRRHGRDYASEFPPHGHSDHLPMAWLALQGLGAGAARQAAFAAAYLPRLRPLPLDDPHRHRQEALLREIHADGVAAVLDRTLPRLISAWHREAYHPLIRLGYGVEFGVAEEVAAGLAYLEASGPSPALEDLAVRARPAPEPSAMALFRRASGWQVDLSGAGSFTERAETVLGQPAMADLANTIPDNLRQVSRAALAAFASTHDFFALHLVTGSHAFRIVYPHAGPHADAVLNLGLLAGYAAIGAPAIDEASLSAPDGTLTPQRLLELCTDDEHHLKVAYSAWAQARHWQDPAYLTAVARYLVSA